jgi:sulfane dehydrogenase subunit SoxC
VTPVNQFFLRNHHGEPDLRMANWTLTVEGRVAHPLRLRFSDLLEAPPSSMEAVLECAGNGAGGPAGALVANGQWEGVALAYCLQQAQPRPDASRVLLVGADRGSLLEGVPAHPYARLLSLEQALQPDALLAFRLNQEFLPRRHGFPVRAVVPGLYAMNWVKWLERIVVLNDDDRPDEFFASGMNLLYQRTFHKDGPDSVSAVAGILVKSWIVSPVPEAKLASGRHTISGFAWAGRNPLGSVDISTDAGHTWRPATLVAGAQPFGWCFWRYEWEAAPGVYQLMSRASDSAGNRQPLSRDVNRRDGYELNWSAPTRCSVA